MSAKRVLIAHVPYEHRGGEDVHVETLVQAYGRIGFDPVLYPKQRVPQKHSAIAAVASLIPGRVPSDFITLWERERPDFIHLHNAFPVLGPGFFQWVIDQRISLIMTVHNHRFFCSNGLALRDERVCKDCFDAKLGWRPLIRNCNQSVVKSGYHAIALTEMRTRRLYETAVKKFIAPSPYIRSELIRFGVSESKIDWVPNPIPMAATNDSTFAKRFDVLYAGRLSREKGVLPLLEIFQKELPDLKLGVIGSGPDEEQVKRVAARNPNVTFLGAVTREDVLRLIHESRIGVLPSICNEILPTFVLECFFQGKRCVMADQESVRWLAQDGFPGSVAPLSSAQEFAMTIRQALAQELVDPFAIQKMRETFSIDSFCSRLMKVADEVMS